MSGTQQRDESRAGWERSERAMAAGLVILGLVMLLFGAAPLGVLNAGLAEVSPVDPSQMSPTDAGQAAMYAPFVVAGILLVTDPRSKPNGRVVDRGALLGAGALCVVTGFFASLGNAFYFADPEQTCAYSSCWPMGFQSLMATVPAGLAAIAMVIMGTAFRNARWAWRAFTPVATLLIASAIQHLTSTDWIVPLLTGPPPMWAF